MIPTIIIVTLALGWLLRETDYLRVKLLVGAENTITYQYKSWDDILRDKPSFKNLPDFLKMDGFEPLCGWDWLKNTMHIIPEYKIELDFGNRRYKMSINKPDILKEVIKVNTQKHKPYSPPRLKFSNKGNGYS